MNRILFPIILFLLINGGGGIYFVYWRNPLTILLFLLLIIYFINNFNSIKKSKFYATTIALLIFLLFLAVNYIYAIPGQSMNTYAYATLSFLIAFLLNSTLKDSFLVNFYKILEIYKYQALLSFIAVFLFKNYYQLTVVDEETSYYTFFYLSYYLPEDIATASFGGLSFLRNQGLFWEPGILQLYMNILLFLQFFYFNSSLKKILITIFVIISTFSTVGLLLMSMLVLMKYKSLLRKKNTWLALPIFIVFIISLYPVINANIEDKFYGDHQSSSQVRLFDALQAFEMIKDYPWTGIGITNEAYNSLQNAHYFRVFSMFSYNPGGNTNSILAILVMYGIPIGSIWLIALYRQTLFKKQKIIFFILLFFGLLSEPILYRLFFVFLVFNGLSGFFLQINQKKEN